MKIIKISDVMFRCVEFEGKLFLESFQKGQADWVQVEDLTELKVWEYAELLIQLEKHYPDFLEEYAIDHLKGRFI